MEMKIKYPERYQIVHFKGKTNESCLQVSVRTWNEIIGKIVNNGTDFNLTEVKYSLSFTKNVLQPENVLKPTSQE